QLFSSLFMIILIILINTSIYFLFYKISANSELDQLDEQMTAIVENLNDHPDTAQNELLNAYVPTDGMYRVIKADGRPLIHNLKNIQQQKFMKLLNVMMERMSQ